LSTLIAVPNSTDRVVTATEMYLLTVLKVTIKVLAGLVSPEASLLDLCMATFSLCPYMAFSLGAHISDECPF
jgi:hypothetical protein